MVSMESGNREDLFWWHILAFGHEETMIFRKKKIVTPTAKDFYGG